MTENPQDGSIDPPNPPDPGGIAVVRDNQTVAFAVLTLALSWSWWGVAALVLTDGGGLTRALILPGAFGPVVAATVVTWASGDDVRAWGRDLFAWRGRRRWFLVALLVPFGVVLGTTVAYLAGNVPVDPIVVPERAVTYPVVLVFALVLGGGQEEPGWRGFALPRLQRRYDALTAALVVGGLWAVWHLPLFLAGAARNTSGSFGVYLAMVLALSVVLTWLYNESRGSVLVVALAHAGVNATGLLVPITQSVAETRPLAVDLGMVASAWLLALVLVLRYGRETLCSDERPVVESVTRSTAADGDDRPLAD